MQEDTPLGDPLPRQRAEFYPDHRFGEGAKFLATKGKIYRNPKRDLRPDGLSGRQWVKLRKLLKRAARAQVAKNEGSL